MVEDRNARASFENSFSQESGDEVHRDDHPLFIDKADPVRIAVIGDAEIGMGFLHFFLELGERFGFERVGLVALEGVLHIVVEVDDGEIVRELLVDGEFQDTHSVGGVDSDGEMFASEIGKGCEKSVVGRANIFGDRRSFLSGIFPLFAQGQIADFLEAGALADRYRSAQGDFHAIVLFGIVRGGERNGGIDIQAAGGKVDHGSGDDTEVEHITAGVHYTLSEAFEEARAGTADIATDAEAFGFEMGDHGSADIVNIVFIDIIRVDAADIVGLEDTGVHSKGINIIRLL